MKKHIIILFLIISELSLSSVNGGFSYLLSKGNINANSFSDVINVKDTIWAVSTKGIHITRDGGKNWENLFFENKSISAIAYNNYNKTIWVAFANNVIIDGQNLPNGLGLAYTSDFGRSWNEIKQPVDNNFDTLETYGINTIKALPITTTINNLIYDIAFTKNTVWVASFAGGLRKSSDMGKSWKRVVLPPDYLDAIKPSDTLKFSLSPSSGRMGLENNLNHRVFSVASLSDSIVCVGSAGGINISFDDGNSWLKTNATNKVYGISGNFVVSILADTITNNIYIASWKAEGANEFNAVSFTSNYGNTWNIVLNDIKIYNFCKAGNDIIAVSENGIYRSQNSFNWQNLNYFYDESNKLYTFDNKFYGCTSIKKNDTLDIYFAGNSNLVKIEELDNGTMWDGKWKIYFASDENFNVNSSYAYPNPFSPSIDHLLKIKYSTNGETKKVSIRILSFDMQLVRTIIQNAERGIGSHNISNNEIIDYWDGKDDNGNSVANGTYFYRIDIDGYKPIYGKILVIK
jgi:photosystem II stability/assembly factor-like uncharacterized protein